MSSGKERKPDKRPPFLKRRSNCIKRKPVLDEGGITKLRRSKWKQCMMFRHEVILSYDDSRLSPACARGYILHANGKYYKNIKKTIDEVGWHDTDRIHGDIQRLKNMFPKRGPGDEDYRDDMHPLVAMVNMRGQHVYQSTTKILKDYGPTVPIYRRGTRLYHLCLVAIGVSWDIYIGMVEIDPGLYAWLDYFKGKELKRPRLKPVRLKKYDDRKQ
jgi:hypothetical protein